MRHVSTEHLSDSYGAEVSDVTPGSLDALVADCADVRVQMALVPGQRMITIPSGAVALVAGLDTYGD